MTNYKFPLTREQIAQRHREARQRVLKGVRERRRLLNEGVHTFKPVTNAGEKKFVWDAMCLVKQLSVIEIELVRRVII